MSADPDRIPVIVGVGEASERSETVSPLDLAERAASAALGEAPGLAERVDRIDVVGILAGGGPAPASDLAARLRLSPSEVATTTVGGNTPQWLVRRAADDIAAGRLSTVLIAGAEALRSIRQSGLPSTPVHQTADPVVGDPRPGLSEPETAAGLMVPAQVYPLFESAFMHRDGRTRQEHRHFIGSFMARLSAVAATQPHAWFPDPLSPDVIAEPTADNRLVAEPYTKLMNAFIMVDQAAAILVTSLAHATALGLDGQAVFVWAAADSHDVWFPAGRPDLADSPGIRLAAGAALTAASIGVDDLAHIDLYSCFPSAVQAGAEAVGIALDDARGLTVTGGLPYFGGPGNNYSTHAIAATARRLRGQPPGATALVTALGWYTTKHSVGVYGSSPPPLGYRGADTSQEQQKIDATALPISAPPAQPTDAVVDAFTVLYDRDGSAQAAPVIARADGTRLVATADPDELADVSGQVLTGGRVRITGTTYRVLA